MGSQVSPLSLCVNATWLGRSVTAAQQYRILYQVLVYCNAYCFAGGHAMFPGIISVCRWTVNDETLNDPRYYIQHRCSEFGRGAILVSMVKSERHFYFLLPDLWNQAATIWDPDHMTSFQPNTPYYSTMLGEFCRVLKYRPIVYDVVTNGPEDQCQIIREMVRIIHNYGSWGLCGIMALSMMLHSTLLTGADPSSLSLRTISNMQYFIQRFMDACGRDHAACTYTITHTLALVSSISNVAPTCWLYDIADDEEACIDRILAAIRKSPGWSTEHSYNKRKSVLHYMIGWPMTDVAEATKLGWLTDSISMTHFHRIERFGHKDVREFISKARNRRNRLMVFAHIT